MRLLLAFAVLAFLAAPAAASLDAAQAVAIRQGRYDPVVAVAHVGDTITWTNFDLAVHTVTDYDGHFASPSLARGGTFSLTVTEPGVHVYHCIFHALLNGALVVLP